MTENPGHSDYTCSTAYYDDKTEFFENSEKRGRENHPIFFLAKCPRYQTCFDKEMGVVPDKRFGKTTPSDSLSLVLMRSTKNHEIEQHSILFPKLPNKILLGLNQCFLDGSYDARIDAKIRSSKLGVDIKFFRKKLLFYPKLLEVSVVF